MIIDCHGHYTAAHTSWREAQREAFDAGTAPPAYPDSTDDEVRESVETGQLRMMAERVRFNFVRRLIDPKPISTMWTPRSRLYWARRR